MPDWSYRTVLRPLMLASGIERGRAIAVRTLRLLSRSSVGLAAIDFLGHMRPDERLRLRVAGIDLDGPIALESILDPHGEAVAAFSRFGAGLIEVGPVDSPDVVAANLERAHEHVPVAIRISGRDPAVISRIARELAKHAAMFIIESAELTEAAGEERPLLVRLDSMRSDAGDLARDAMRSGAAGVWLANADTTAVRSMRSNLPRPAVLIVSGSVQSPADAWGLLEAGADVVAAGDGLLFSGPGLIKRCNESLLSTAEPPAPPEPLSLDAGRRSWFWGLLLGAAMFGGGILAAIIGSTRVVMPYDESLCGLTRSQMTSINPRLLPFMAHDRVSLAGTMISIGIFYAALAWFGIRRGEHWARAALVASAATGFVTFFYFLGFEYFDPFHAFVTAVLTQFTVLCVALPGSPRQLPAPEWRETPAWRAGQWGQLLFILIGIGLTASGAVISFIGCTRVFVETDLAFMRTTAAQLRVSFDTLVPLIAHDRATLGGMLIANGVVIWLAAQWGMRAGARWLWIALACGGNVAFMTTIAVHLAVGYESLLHLAPALSAWALWNVALILTRGWMTAPASTPVPSYSTAATTLSTAASSVPRPSR